MIHKEMLWGNGARPWHSIAAGLCWRPSQEKKEEENFKVKMWEEDGALYQPQMLKPERFRVNNWRGDKKRLRKMLPGLLPASPTLRLVPFSCLSRLIGRKRPIDAAPKPASLRSVASIMTFVGTRLWSWEWWKSLRTLSCSIIRGGEGRLLLPFFKGFNFGPEEQVLSPQVMLVQQSNSFENGVTTSKIIGDDNQSFSTPRPFNTAYVGYRQNIQGSYTKILTTKPHAVIKDIAKQLTPYALKLVQKKATASAISYAMFKEILS